MASQQYQRPIVPEGIEIKNLAPKHGGGEPLNAETVVRAINRGDTPIVDKYDGINYVVPPGWFEGAYGMVRHFQNRAVVPGTRNPETRHQRSFIGIPNIDPPERCVPFTEAEMRKFRGMPEAIDRTNRSSEADRDHTIVPLGDVMPGMMGAGGPASMRPVIDLSEQATPEAARRAETVLQPLPPEQNEAVQEALRSTAEAEGEAAAAASSGRVSRQRNRGQSNE